MTWAPLALIDSITQRLEFVSARRPCRNLAPVRC